ncbi:MAG TPA: GWxTD domain-containing protein [Gemmatimonadales bacterium]|nr:GWxTD domain-containing protein [Gemmatimonadales bacterium]
MIHSNHHHGIGHGLRRAFLPGFAAFVFVLSPVTARPCAAQLPDQREALEQFRDSLAAVRDTTQLLALKRAMVQVATDDRNNTLLHLKLGFLNLRLANLGVALQYDDAAAEFEWATELEPTWPYGWYGLGLAEYGVGDSQISFVTGIKTMFGKDALSRSADAFAKSADVDPAFSLGLVELARTALKQRVNIKLDVALAALRNSAATSAGAVPQVLLERGRVEREAGSLDSALAAFNAYLRVGGKPGLGLLEGARTKCLLGAPDCFRDYLHGAVYDDPPSVSEYRKDLAFIATDEDLNRFDRTWGTQRAEFLKEFWTTRDRHDLRRDGERLREHYRRYFYARQNFALASTNRHYDIVERYRSESVDFDDRGIIYIRHGEPTDRASYRGRDVEPNESWRYERADGDLIFHFIAREDVQDYKLVESLFDVLGNAATVTLRGTGVSGDPVATELLLSRERLSPIYGRIQSSGFAGTNRYQAEERSLGRTSIEVGTSTDSYELTFARPLRGETQVLAVGHDEHGPQLQLTFAIPGSALEGTKVQRGTLYPVRVLFVAQDSAGNVVSSCDTTRFFLAGNPVPQHEYLVGRVAVGAPAGKLRYRLAVQHGEHAGLVTPTDTVDVVRPDGTTFALSDPVLGAKWSTLLWLPTPVDSVYFNPQAVFGSNDLLELYYEVYGLEPMSTYKTQLAVKKGSGGGGFLGIGKLFGGGGAEISIKFEEQAPGPIVRSRRTIELGKLKAGQYTLEVTVTDAQGRTERRQQAFRVVAAP